MRQNDYEIDAKDWRGPFPVDAVVRLIFRGHVAPDVLVRRVGATDWISASRVAEIAVELNDIRASHGRVRSLRSVVFLVFGILVGVPAIGICAFAVFSAWSAVQLPDSLSIRRSTDSAMGVSSSGPPAATDSGDFRAQIIGVDDWAGMLRQMTADSRLPPDESLAVGLLFIAHVSLRTVDDIGTRGSVVDRDFDQRLRIFGVLAGSAGLAAIKDFRLNHSGVNDVARETTGRIIEEMARVGRIDRRAFQSSHSNLCEILRRTPRGVPPTFELLRL